MFRAPGLLLAALVAGLSCGPAERRDGALSIELQGLAEQVLELELTLHAAGRSETLRLPAAPVVTAFDAVPAGPVRLDLRLFDREREVDARLGLVAEVHEARTTTLVVDLAPSAPVRVLDPPEHASQRITDGPIPVRIRAAPDAALNVAARAGDAPIMLTVVERGEWFGSVDPAALLANTILPARLMISIEACPEAGPCSVTERPVEVHRRRWAVSLQDAARATPPVVDPARGRVWIGDERGMLRGIELETGTLRFEHALAPPITRPIGLGPDHALIASGSGHAWILDLEQGAISAGPLDLGSEEPTGAAWTGERFVIGAGDRLLSIDPAGVIEVLARFAGRIFATPLADGEGIVAADWLGNVTSFSPAGEVLFRASAEGVVFATPLRHQGLVWIATSTGKVLRFDGSGAMLGAVLELGAPVAHAPVALGDQVVIAADRRLHFIGAQTIEVRRLPASVTGAPARWSDTEVVAGLDDGRVIIASSAADDTLSRVGRTAFSPVPRPESRVLVAGSRGNLEYLQAEDR